MLEGITVKVEGYAFGIVFMVFKTVFGAVICKENNNSARFSFGSGLDVLKSGLRIERLYKSCAVRFIYLSDGSFDLVCDRNICYLVCKISGNGCGLVKHAVREEGSRSAGYGIAVKIVIDFAHCV